MITGGGVIYPLCVKLKLEALALILGLGILCLAALAFLVGTLWN